MPGLEACSARKSALSFPRIPEWLGIYMAGRTRGLCFSMYSRMNSMARTLAEPMEPLNEILYCKLRFKEGQ